MFMTSKSDTSKPDTDADDCHAKSLSAAAPLPRVRMLLRGQNRSGPGAENEAFSDCEFERGSERVFVHGSSVTLTHKEFVSSICVPELTERDIVLAGPAGISLASERSAHLASNEDVAITSGRHVGFAVGHSLFASVSNTRRSYGAVWAGW